MATRLSRLSSKLFIAAAAMLAVLGSAQSATLSLQDIPLYLSTRADPNVMLNLSVETPMGGAAYNDNVGVPASCTSTGRQTISSLSVGTCYFSNYTYLGYFNPDKCYRYDTAAANQYFYIQAATINTAHECTGLSAFSGNFLNWATMTAIDMFIQPMTGGNRTTDTTSLTVVRRARKVNNDSWFPYKVIGTAYNVAVNTVTPYADTQLYIYNTNDVSSTVTAFGVQFSVGLQGSNNTYQNRLSTAGSDLKNSTAYVVQAKVCESATNKEANCQPYGSTYYKPEGLIQQHAMIKRFGVMSYTLDNVGSRDGGVLRENMKYVGPILPNGTANSKKEYDATGANAGILITDPDGVVAAGATGLNSGVINYINKFSDAGYKSYDPIGELFYEGIRYFKNIGPTPEYSTGITRTSADAKAGGFWFANQASDWNDPMQYRCQKNFVVAINDANPWLDKKLPGTSFMNSTFVGAAGATITLTDGDYGEPSNPDTSINVTSLTNSVGAMEGLNTAWPSTGTWTSGTASGAIDSVGGGVGTFDNACGAKTGVMLGEVMGTCPYPPKQNSYYIAGLAYYANTTDLRTQSNMGNDQGIQNIESFIIDTQEFNTNPLDGPKNQLWLAGKYGGFTDTITNTTTMTGDGIPQTSEWDANGDGIPDNYVLATDPTRLVQGLSEAFTFIDSRTSSASSASLNAGSISSDTRVYQAKFKSGEWSGELLAYQINPLDGSLSAAPGWTGGKATVQAAASRQIITANASRTAGQAFNWSALDLAHKNLLDSATSGVAGGVANKMLDYIRGSAAREAATLAVTPSAGPTFRNRPTTKLGDLINSSPVYVGKPAFNYPDSLDGSGSTVYSAFVAAKASRTPMVYVGGNDGMLHAFNADDDITGSTCTDPNCSKEMFAYIPTPVIKNLKFLTSTTYSHKYFVDGTPQLGDAYFSSAWHTMLVGGLNKGGQGIYALEVTNPTDFNLSSSLETGTNPGKVFKWEFTDANDVDLGYTFGQPAIVRMNNGKWAAVFSNGYNNSEADGLASTTGFASLMIRDVGTGALIAKLSTETGTVGTPNGLSTPILVDLDGDRIVDYAYAGDLYGNMWKFDLTNANAANWKVAYGTTAAPLPLFTTTDGSASPGPYTQPITEKPVVIRGPNGIGMMVLFGTGRYLETSDTQLTPVRTQTFYGIWDKNSGTATDRVTTGRTNLQVQSITDELYNQVYTNFTTNVNYTYNLRVTTPTLVNWNTKLGWYMDLQSPVQSYQAEKSISNPIVRNGRLIFTTLIPNAVPCEYGGESWLMEVDALTGRRGDESPFDLNHDRDFALYDWARTTPPKPASGMQFINAGILPSPGVVSDKDVEFKYAPGTNGVVQTLTENPGKGGTGRQSWRQIR